MNWMSLFFISLNLLFGFLMFIPLNKNGRHLQLNRIYLLFFPLLALALGLLQHFGEGNPIIPFTIELPLIEITSTEVAQTSINPINWLLWTYIVGVAVSLAHFAWSLYNIRHPKDAQLLHTLGRQRIYLITSRTNSFSHFNAIYISEYQLDNAEFIVEHELAHSRQKHSIDLIVIRLMRSLLWFHPIMYMWESKMKENHEYLADRACVNHTTDITLYSYALLSTHLGVSIPDLANGFNRQSLLQKRIIQLKTQNTFNMKKVILIPAMLTGVVLLTSVQLETQHQPSADTSVPSIQQKVDDETKPEFTGGMSALIEYMQANINYPKELADKNLEAKVFVKFIVTKTGEIKDAKVARGSEHEPFNTEAIRVVSSMPNWTPGMKGGKAVSAEMTLPIQFALAK